ncbi:MAG: MarR family transcriptional regulator [Actinomycetota bacterium]|nr:MarR family transcriptional regulator [Actinomycetota bacterium]
MPLEEIPTAGLLGRAYNQLGAVIFRRLSADGPADTRPTHGNVLEHLEIEDGLRLTDIASRAGITPQSVGALVDELEQLSYVERRVDPEDRRAKRVFLTAKGRENARRSWEVVRALEQELSERLGARRLGELRGVLMEIIDSVPANSEP